MTTDIIDFLGFEKGIIDVTDTVRKPMSPIKVRFIEEVKAFGIDKIYFSGDFPSVYIKKVDRFDKATLQSLRSVHKNIWNQRRVPFLYVESPTEIRIYNCYERPISTDDQQKSIDDVQLFRADEQHLEELRSVFGQVSIDSGDFWSQYEYAKYLDHKKRVDKALIGNLKETRRKLIQQGVSVDIIHDLLLRSLFLLYLEDRKATDQPFYDQYSKGATSYFDLLEDVDATYRLYGRLEQAFNGNLSPVTPKERSIVKKEHLTLIKNCFWDVHPVHSNQTTLFRWRAFDFSIISIELISEIYEEFLSTEQGEDATANDGAYYTPHVLVEFMLNKSLPWADKDTKSYDLKIIDPTCGSGIFLVESFKRLVHRWECQHPGQKIGFQELIALVQNNIFGVEKNADAIKVAAFSIYLAVLDKLDPKTLWQDHTFPYLIYNPHNPDSDQQGRNLYLMSSLGDGPFLDHEYDLVVGNPPFGEGSLSTEAEEYVTGLGFPQEHVTAFMHKAAQMCPNGDIALISTSKILFNTGSKYENFRNFLLEDCYVKSIYNFSILRQARAKFGGHLFASATVPVCIIFYQSRLPSTYSDTILYCTPKTFFKGNMIDGISINQSDVKYLPRTECKNSPINIWKVAMWGSQSDFALIKRLKNVKSLGEELEERRKNDGWSYGNGYQTSHPANDSDPEISELPTIKTKAIQRYWTKVDESTSFDTPEKFRRFGDKPSYFGPHVLVKKGQKEKRFCASFIENDCAFRDGVYGVVAGETEKDVDKLKTLTAYINSSCAAYYLFLTASSFGGIEREQIYLKEYWSLPSLLFCLSDTQLSTISGHMDSIISALSSPLFSEIIDLEDKIDSIIYDAYELSEQEKYLIRDSLEYSLGLFLDRENSSALKRCSLKESKAYAETLCSSLNSTLEYEGGSNTWCTVYDIPAKVPLNVVSLHFNTSLKTEDEEQVLVEESTEKINALLREINEYTYEKYSESIYFRKTVKYAVDDTIYLIKPNEKRFWSRSAAMNDADDIMVEFAYA